MSSSRNGRVARPIEQPHGWNRDKGLEKSLVNNALTSLDFETDGVGSERGLALHYAPHDRRPALEAVWRLDARMRRLFATGRNAMLSQIKLAWWEERLEALPSDHAAPEPLLRRLATFATDEAAARNLAALAGAWRALDDPPWASDAVEDYARLRGQGLVVAAALALGASARVPEMVAGEGYALVDLAMLTGDPDARAEMLDAARSRYASAGRFAWSHTLRPLGMIVELARADAGSGAMPREGSPGRVARMAWHALTGR